MMHIKCPYCDGTAINHVDSRFKCGFCIEGILHDVPDNNGLESKGVTVYFKGPSLPLWISAVGFIGLVCLAVGLLEMVLR